ncbi:MAG: group II intron reverse transcriptase/maturase [Bacteroidia bacterium]|nr:group II intron reverse transcriptase/maturase [Bacteroidia bacterium]
MVTEAYKSVKKGGESAGIDGVSFTEFAENLSGNLYKIWNRMASGSYFPPSVKEVEIRKNDGKMRKLGIPTIGDRIAQSVVKEHLEKAVDSKFEENSYGYRKGMSAETALQKCKENCWKYAWVIDLDIKGFFDNIDRDLLMETVREHTEEKWVLMYIERWLNASIIKKDGTQVTREKGTPQGGVISPLLANIFLDKVFDKWLLQTFKGVTFERYADDIIIHCQSQKAAEYILDKVRIRLQDFKLETHPDKTKIVYCKQANRNEKYSVNSFKFLGVEFRPQKVKNKQGEPKSSFKKIGDYIKSLSLHKQTDRDIYQLTELINDRLTGWFNYFKKWGIQQECGYFFYKLNQRLIKWAMNRYKRLNSKRKAIGFLRVNQKLNPNLFVHWKYGFCL